MHYYENLELRNAYERVKVLSEQLTTMLGIARELAEALEECVPIDPAGRNEKGPDGGNEQGNG